MDSECVEMGTIWQEGESNYSGFPVEDHSYFSLGHISKCFKSEAVARQQQLHLQIIV